MTAHTWKSNLVQLGIFLASVAAQDPLCMGPVDHRGYLVDNYCWDLPNHTGFDGSNLEFAPWDHKVGCLLLSDAEEGKPPCVESGYALLSMKDDGSYEREYLLDKEGNERALKIIKESNKTDHYFVQVTEGMVCEYDGNGTRFFQLSGADDALIECEQFEHTGYLVDNYCWDLPNHTGFDGSNLEFEPWDHKVGCLLLSDAEEGKPPCVESGYALLKEKDDGSFDRAVMLDKESNERALKVIKASEKKDNYAVSVKGYMCGEGANVTLTEILEADVPALVPPTPAPSAGFAGHPAALFLWISFAAVAMLLDAGGW